MMIYKSVHNFRKDPTNGKELETDL